MIRRNTANQLIAFPELSLKADGVVVTSGASIRVKKDAAATAAGAGALAHDEDGIWNYTPTQGESDCAILKLYLKATGAQTIVLNCVTTGADTSAVALGANTTTPATPANVTDARDVVTALLPSALEGGRMAAVLSTATQTQITAIETFATRVTTGLVQDGAVYQFTANMLELAPSGAVSVLPATGIVADRSAGTTLLPVVGETISQAITVYQSDGTTAVDLSGKTLKIIFETMAGTDVAVVLAADITISGASSNVVTFAYPSAVTASERVLRFAIRDAAAPLTMYLQGICSVVAAPKVDA